MLKVIDIHRLLPSSIVHPRLSPARIRPSSPIFTGVAPLRWWVEKRGRGNKFIQRLVSIIGRLYPSTITQAHSRLQKFTISFTLSVDRWQGFHWVRLDNLLTALSPVKQTLSGTLALVEAALAPSSNSLKCASPRWLYITRRIISWSRIEKLYLLMQGASSTVTRAFPSSGTSTSLQRDLYTTVLNTQKAMINLCTEESGMSLYDLHARSCRALREELTQIGFKVDVGDVEKLYPHFLCHPIGFDLQESDNLNRSESIYVPNDPAYPKAFWGIGVRIEDEILVGKVYPTVLSVAAPKEVSVASADVEGACQGLLGFEPGP